MTRQGTDEQLMYNETQILEAYSPVTERYRIHEEHPLYFITMSVIHWLPVFVGAESCCVVTDSLRFCHEQKGLRINAFVIMPTHLHLILFDDGFDNQRLQPTIADMRKYTGRRLADFCDHSMPPVFGQLMRSGRRADRHRHFWQPTRHPVAIHSQSLWRTKFDYVHDNPRRKGLVLDATSWRFSSAAFWLLDPPGESDVPLTGVQW